MPPADGGSADECQGHVAVFGGLRGPARDDVILPVSQEGTEVHRRLAERDVGHGAAVVRDLVGGVLERPGQGGTGRPSPQPNAGSHDANGSR